MTDDERREFEEAEAVIDRALSDSMDTDYRINADGVSVLAALVAAGFRVVRDV